MKSGTKMGRLLSLLLALTLVLGFVTPAGAASEKNVIQLDVEKVDNDLVSAELPLNYENGASPYCVNEEPQDEDLDELVRVSIVLDADSVVEAGYAANAIAEDAEAADYRQQLSEQQQAVIADIQREALDGRELDVVWNLTLATNLISANVPRSALDEIAAMDGIKTVVEETRYEPQVFSVGGTYEPQMAVSGQMTGSQQAWQYGFTGAGTRVAVIDTGLDTDHQSFDPDAFLYGIAEASEDNGVDYAQQLLSEQEIASVLTQLNAYKRLNSEVTAKALYINAKVPFGYNYVDGNLDVTHDNDSMGSHGSHVSGIAAANRFLKRGEGYVNALDEVFVTGNAPDAQLLVMKVFGQDSGGYDSDIMAAIEDALVLGADVINLSLGSSVAGRTESDEQAYRDLFASLVETDTVVSISSGNSYEWAQKTATGMLYNDGINFATDGSPGTYTNSYAVASVDNDGGMGTSLSVNDSRMTIVETTTDSTGAVSYTNALLSTLDTSAEGTGTEYEFVLLDGVGKAEEFDGIDVEGKIVFVSRGEVSFSTKANNAAGLKAAATVVYNNEHGAGVTMDLSDYVYAAPAVSISMADGQRVKAAAQEKTTDAGATYYTGTITVIGAKSAIYSDSEYKTMSTYSSWGVPSDLTLKPEISAPGGSIYSVNGVDTSGTAYELMSGTSMAAPQISGMAALVLQYLQESGIEDDTLTARGLTQALLGSTADPMRSAESGNYYALMQQGGGLANVADAMRTPVYITIPGTLDGKVKVELGDDPDRTGEYTFQFELNNLSDEDVSYLLSADLFTQAVSYDDDQVGYLSTLTRSMDADVRFAVDGKAVEADENLSLNYDFNGDGRVTVADAQALLDYVTGGSEISNAQYADFNGDGKVNTYDVHLFLCQAQGAVEVPANGTVTVSVTMTLTDSERAVLAQDYPVGAYVEAFVHADPLATEEGELLPQLNLPVFGFYGGWNEASMYDVGSYTQYMHGTETRTSYFDTMTSNAVMVGYGENSSLTWYFGGNPIEPDETYLPERNAISVARGDSFQNLLFALVRNAGAYKVEVTNTTDHETLLSEVGGQLDAAYYVEGYSSWLYAPRSYELNLSPDMDEGDKGNIALTTVVDLYAKGDEVDWSRGSTMEIPFQVDNTAPVIENVEVDQQANVLRVTATDNQYVAGVVLYDVTGSRILSTCGADQTAEAGQTVTLEVPLDYVNGYKFVIQVVDYAVNKSTYKLKETIGEPDPMPEMLYYSNTFGEWIVGSWPEEGHVDFEKSWFTSDIDPVAATAVGSWVYFTDDDRNLYVAPGDNMWEVYFVCTLDKALVDMTYDAENGIIYGVTTDKRMVTIDRMTGEMADIGQLSPWNLNPASLAYDGNGTFYTTVGTATGTSQNYYFFSFTLDSMASNTFTYLGMFSNVRASAAYSQCLEYNPADGKLYYAIRNNATGYELWKFDPATMEPNAIVGESRYFYGDVSSIIFPDWSEEANSWYQEGAAPTAVALSRSSCQLFVGKSLSLTAYVMPWNTNDHEVVWSSSDETVATVDQNGTITGVGEGTASITAASASDPSITASCAVSVSVLRVNASGILVDADSVSRYYTWDAASGKDWVAGDQVVFKEGSDIAAVSASVTSDGKSFWMLDQNDNVYEVDMESGLVVDGPYTFLKDENYDIHGIAYSSFFSTDDVTKLYYFRENQLIRPRDVASKDSYLTSFTLDDSFDYLAAITVAGTEKYQVNSYTSCDSEILYMIDNNGVVWRANVYETGYYSKTMYLKYTKTASTLPENTFGSKSCNSLVVGEDGALYLTAYKDETTVLYRLAYDEVSGVYEAMKLATYGDKVWPALLFEVTTPAGGETASVAGLQSIDVKASAPVTGGVVIDRRLGTVTVPVYAKDTTNGMVELSYDAATLEVESVSSGAPLNSVLEANGMVKVGFAAADAFTGNAATVKFRVIDEDAVYTTMWMNVPEDGAQTPDETEKLLLRLKDTTETAAEPEETEKTDASFADVQPGDWFYDDVMEMVGKGYMNGVSAQLFDPNGTLTRGMLVTILHRMEGEPAPSGSNGFADVADGMYYTTAITWAAEQELVTGYDAATFGPNDKITRQQLATILWRYAQYKKMDVRANGSVMPELTDRSLIASWAGEAVSWAYSRGIVRGKDTGAFDPEGSATRAEAATMLNRFLTLAKNTAGDVR